MGFALNDAVSVAVIGTGRWGRNLVRKFYELPESKLVTVCDLDEEKLAKISHQYPGTQTATDLKSVLSDDTVEAVVVASPAPLHYELARQALNAGKHVFVEKPITLNVGHAEELIALAEDRGLTLMVGHLLIYHPGVNLIKTIIDKNEVGGIHYLYSQRLNLGTVRKDENALWSLAPHDIAVMLYLTGKKPIMVAAHGQCYLRAGVEDVVFFTVYFEDSVMAHAHVSWLDPHKTRKFTIVGKEKMIVFDDMESSEKVRLYDKGADVATGYKSYGEDLTLRFGDISIPSIKMEEPLALECRHFLSCVRSGKRPITDGRNGLEVLKILQSAQTSLDSGGKPVELVG